MPVSGKLYYSHHPDGRDEKPPVVLIHGAGGMHLYWPPEIRRLRGHNVYAIDLPGHGKSEMCDGQQTIGDYSRLLLYWLEALKIHRAIFVGHSMGSAISLTLAIHHPEHVVSLVLVGAGARLRVNPELLNFASDPTTFYKCTSLLLNCAFSARASKRLVELAGMRMEVTRQSVLSGDLQACNAFDVMGKLGSINQKTLVMVGEEDMLTPVRYAQYLASSIPDAQLMIIPNAGHMVMLEQPHLTAEGISSFLKGISFHPGEGN